MKQPYKNLIHIKKITSVLLLFAIQLLSLPLYPQNKTDKKIQTLSSKPQQNSQPSTTVGNDILKEFGKLPVTFETNLGQTDKSVKFLSRGTAHSIFLTEEEAVIALQKKSRKGKNNSGDVKKYSRQSQIDVLRMVYLNKSSEVRITAEDETKGKSNYLKGNNSDYWKTNIPRFNRVRYENIYPNIDLVYYGNQENLEYDFVVNPGAVPESIALKFEGAEKLKIDPEGNLKIKIKNDWIQQNKPIIYQEVSGERNIIQGEFSLSEDNVLGFSIGSYDKTLPLIIDPVISYLSYLGGSMTDYGNDIAVDTLGNAYVTGEVQSANFPVKNAIKSTITGTSDAFVTKINPSGNTLIYSTYLGGADTDVGKSIAVDLDGNAYIGGFTRSTNFPTPNGIQPAFGGTPDDGFISKLNSTGSNFVYSTYLGGAPDGAVGGSDQVNAIAVDESNNVYVTGFTSSMSNFPVVNAAQDVKGSRIDAFVSKINSAGNGYVFSTYLGGASNAEDSKGIAADSAGNAYVAGHTGSTNFPVLNPIQGSNAGDVDAFVVKYNASGGKLYATYLGGSSTEYCYGIALDTSNNVYIGGSTASPTNFPKLNAFQSTFGGGVDGFITKINNVGNGLVYSSYIGGSGSFDAVFGIAVDGPGNAFITGQTNSANFPLEGAIQGSRRGDYDAFVTKVSALGNPLLFSTYLGGNTIDKGSSIALSSCGDPYVFGDGDSTDLVPVNAFQPAPGGGRDGFVTKIGDNRLAGVAPNPTVSGPGTVGIGYYTFPASIDPEIMVDRKTKVEAQVYYPQSFGDVRPLLIFLHGNHGTCGNYRLRTARYDADNKYTIDGNCLDPLTNGESPSAKGYEYLATELAKAGYFVISINANLGITGANDGEIANDPAYIQARGKLVMKHLQRLYEWNTSGTPPDKRGTIGIDLRNRLDFNNVGLMGHSRGGEGVRAAYNIYNSSSSTPAPEAALLNEIILDNSDPTGVTITGAWRTESIHEGYYNTNYLTDDHSGLGTKTVTFTPNFPAAGRYRTFIRYSRPLNTSPAFPLATNAPIQISHNAGSSITEFNLNRVYGNPWTWVPLTADFSFTPSSFHGITIGNGGANGTVIADSVRFIPYVDPPSTPWKSRIPGLTIKGIFEIGPTDIGFPASLTPEGTNWNVLLPMCDRDIRELDGVRVFDRFMLNSATPASTTTQKSTFTVWGTNHNFYNTQWQFDDFYPRFSTTTYNCIGLGNNPLFGTSVTPPDFPDSLLQRQTALAGIKAFFLANVGAAVDPALNQNFNPRYEMNPSTPGATRIERGFSYTPNNGQTIIIDDFNKSGAAGENGPGAGNASSGITVSYGVPGNRVPLHSANLQSGKIEWTTANSMNYFQSNLPSAINLTASHSLDFRMSRQTMATLNVPGSTNFTVQLVKNDGTLSNPVELCKYATIIGPVGGYTLSGTPPMPVQILKPILQTVRIPLADFSTDLSQIKGVRFTFNISPKGGIWIANIRTTSLP